MKDAVKSRGGGGGGARGGGGQGHAGAGGYISVLKYKYTNILVYSLSIRTSDTHLQFHESRTRSRVEAAGGWGVTQEEE